MFNESDKENFDNVLKSKTLGRKADSSNILACNMNIMNQIERSPEIKVENSDIDSRDKTFSKDYVPSSTPQKVVTKGEPITPTSNLKMLVSAASFMTPANTVKGVLKKNTANFSQNFNSEICEKENKMISSNICIKQANDLSLIQSNTENVPVFKPEEKNPALKGDEKKMAKVLQGRKEKSLGLLCKRFLSIYPEYSPSGTTIMLDDVVRSLNIGRRRVYDIVNVLESMEMIVRQAKNRYVWFGKSRLAATLTKLKALAVKVYGNSVSISKKSPVANAAPVQVKEIKGYIKIAPKPQSLSPADGESATFLLTIPLSQDFQFKEDGNNQPIDDATNSIMDGIITNDQLKESNRSLGILCQKFIMLFMVTKGGILSLDHAAKMLFQENDAGSVKCKTKVRRLYDIANILTSINFLEKCQGGEGSSRRAAYKWIGFDLEQLNSVDDTKKAFENQENCNTRHSLLSQAESKKSVSRKLHSRSLSAHQLTLKDDLKEERNATKFPRTVSACIKLPNDCKDGFDIGSEENDMEIVDGSQKRSLKIEEEEPNESPNQVLFKKKLKKLCQQFPDKFAANGLLGIISDGKADAYRRRLSEEFPENVVPPFKKVKVSNEELSSATKENQPTSEETNIPSDESSHTPTGKQLVDSSNQSAENGIEMAPETSQQEINSETTKMTDVDMSNQSKTAFLAIPTTIKSLGGPTRFLLANVGIGTSLAKQSGVLKVLPILPQTSNNRILVKLNHNPPKNQTESGSSYSKSNITLNHGEKAENSVPQQTDAPFAYITPPHLINNLGKPTASPIVFPNMAPETPTATSGIPTSLFSTVTRKLMP